MLETIETIRTLAALLLALAAENRPPTPEELAAALAAQRDIERRWAALAPQADNN
jgi:hypothetical protein